MSNNTYKFKCPNCDSIAIKYGINKQGKQRYHCNHCGDTFIIKKEDSTKRNRLEMFVNWLIDSTKLKVYSNLSQRTFYNQTAWCWDITPVLSRKENKAKYVIVDATYLAHDLGIMIIRDEEHIIGFRWVKSENYEDYVELFKTIEQPEFLICDGNKTITKAALKVWKNIKIQRCIFHIWLYSKNRVGKRSPYKEIRAFRRHIGKLLTVDTLDRAERWYKHFLSMCDENKDFIDERAPSFSSITGEQIGSHRVHQNLYSVIRMIKTLYKNDRLFLYLKHDIPKTTNGLEGGINARLKELIKSHRGISLEHQKRLVEWYLISRSKEGIKGVIKMLKF
jgi:transposase-like protein